MRVEVEHLENRDFVVSTSGGEFIIKSDNISPLEHFLGALATCSGVDMIELPKKAHKSVENLKIELEAKRSDDAPNRLINLHLIYKFSSDVSEMVARRWVLASLESYCSAINSIRDGVKIYYSIEFNGKMIAQKDSIISGHIKSDIETKDRSEFEEE